MSLQFLKPAFVCLMLAIGIPYAAQVQAHGGLSLADDVCKLTIGPYTMHFTGYQPDSTRRRNSAKTSRPSDAPWWRLTTSKKPCVPCPPKCASSATPAPAAGSPDRKNNKTWRASPSCTFRPRWLHQFRIPVCPARQIRRSRDRGRKRRIRLPLPILGRRAQGTSPYLIVGIAALVVAAVVFFLRGRKSSNMGAA